MKTGMAKIGDKKNIKRLEKELKARVTGNGLGRALIQAGASCMGFPAVYGTRATAMELELAYLAAGDKESAATMHEVVDACWDIEGDPQIPSRDLPPEEANLVRRQRMLIRRVILA
jgi:hypothetical protein